MHLLLAGIKSDKTDSENVFTANLVADSKAFVSISKAADKPLPDLAYIKGHATAPAVYAQASAHAVSLGFPDLHSYVLHLYVTRDDAKNAQKSKDQQTKAMQDLCARACVFRLPRHSAEQYEIATEAPSIPTLKAFKIDPGKFKKVAIDSELHRAFIRAQYAEVGTDIVEFVGDRYPKLGLLI